MAPLPPVKSLIRIFPETQMLRKEFERHGARAEGSNEKKDDESSQVADKSHEELLMREWLLIGLERSGFRLGMDGTEAY